MKLIPEWKRAYRFLSVQVAALIALLSIAMDYLPQLQQYLPADWVKWGALAVIAARVLKQSNRGDGNA
jgi:hypothetical protein